MKASRTRLAEACSGLIPIDALGTASYKGTQGGLYPDGSNVRPRAHDAAGLSLARAVCPLDAGGEPDVRGRIVLVSIGMSNTSTEFRRFSRLVRSDPRSNPRLVLVDGGQRGAGASRITGERGSGSNQSYWGEIDRRLKAGRVTRSQVQAAWLKVAEAYPTAAFPEHVLELKRRLEIIVQELANRFPNLRLGYCSSRIFAGYASRLLNTEPFAYESGFAVKWLIEDQINGSPGLAFDGARGSRRAPWLAWGPYLWANGLAPGSDGLCYAASDLASDGTHPARGACRKVSERLHDFFTRDSTTSCWFARTACLEATRADAPG